MERPIEVLETTEQEDEDVKTTTFKVRFRGGSLGRALAEMMAANDPPTPDLDIPPEEGPETDPRF